MEAYLLLRGSVPAITWKRTCYYVEAYLLLRGLFSVEDFPFTARPHDFQRIAWSDLPGGYHASGLQLPHRLAELLAEFS